MKDYTENKTDIRVDLGRGLKLKNPVMSASGTYGYGMDFVDFFEPDVPGAIISKGLSLHPSTGNPPPRIAETPCGMLNAIGLENIGVKAYLKDKLPVLIKHKVKVICNIYGHSQKDYEKLAAVIEDNEYINAIELNISCPNVKEGGMAFGTSALTAAALSKRVRRVFSGHLMVKLSPNVTDIVEIARAVEGEGADSLSCINTLLGIAVDIKNRKHVLANRTGGLSGPAIKPIALKMVWETASAVNIPVVGVGGIASASDAIEFIMAGASAVQVGSAAFANPNLIPQVIGGISQWLDAEHIASIKDITGVLDLKR